MVRDGQGPIEGVSCFSRVRGEFDGDESPAESCDESQHSKMGMPRYSKRQAMIRKSQTARWSNPEQMISFSDERAKTRAIQNTGHTENTVARKA